MSSSDYIEQTAATIDDAIRQALELLGAEEDDVTIEILSTPRTGVLGLGVRQARVRVTRRPPPAAQSEAQSPPPAAPSRSPRPEPERRAPAPQQQQASRQPRRDDQSLQRRDDQSSQRRDVRTPERHDDRREDRRDDRREASASEDGDSVDADGNDSRRNVDRGAQTQEAIGILSRVLELMGEKCEVVPGPEHDPDSVELEIRGDGSGILIGRHGQTLDALEYLVNRLLARHLKDALNITLDTEAYRARRRNQIHRMALSMGEQAKREHSSVKLDPMAPRERRIVHLALKDDPMITTRSIGEGYMRAIEIVPVGPARKPPPPPPRERERGEGAIGEQGGFKRGQKRII